MSFKVPVSDITHTLNHIAGLPALLDRGLFEDLDGDTAAAIIEEAARFAEEELVPLNRVGDEHHARLANGEVTMPPGWPQAYRKWVEGGWGSLPCSKAHGGQGLPLVLATAVNEIWNAANMAFGLGPLLTQGAVEALALHGAPDLQRLYLPKLVSGEWTGTMQLTEPQAGSDLRFLRTRAVPQGDGTYRITGTKIYITYGEHGMTDNIIHLVLARLPDAPPGTRGISLFLVPKLLVNADGSLGVRNDVVCTKLEHKLGIHGSPTCVMTYGDKGGAVGWLVGEPNRGLAAMFTMMIQARIAVGAQGAGIAERAYRQALGYARERKQGAGPDMTDDASVAIIEHPDVKRMLLDMHAKTAAARAICYRTAIMMDYAHHSADEAERAFTHAKAALLTPVAKSYATDTGVEVASTGIQVHGGMGYVEETGAAQHYRDARIATIYEGTNGIQAIDLVTRKLGQGNGEVLERFLNGLDETVREVKGSNEPALGHMGECLESSVGALKETSRWMLRALQDDRGAGLSGATPYQRLFGLAAGGVYLARGALSGLRHANGDAAAHIVTARHFAENLAVETAGLKHAVTHGHETIGHADAVFAEG